MAVPKKRTSKAKKNSRKANWKRKAVKSAQKSLSLAKSILRGKTTSFVYRLYVDEQIQNFLSINLKYIYIKKILNLFKVNGK